MLALMFTYDFDYSWPLRWGHVLLAMAGAALALLGWRFGWRRSRHRGFRPPVPLGRCWRDRHALRGADRVAAAARDRVVHPGRARRGPRTRRGIGPGHHRPPVRRPQARVTALDAYRGYFGIDDNTPERLMRNARAAGVADRVHVQVADMRRLPFEAGASTRHSAWPPSITCPGTVLRRRYGNRTCPAARRAVADREPEQRRMDQGGNAVVAPRPRLLEFDPEPAPMDGGARRRRVHACRDRDTTRHHLFPGKERRATCCPTLTASAYQWSAPARHRRSRHRP